MGRLFGKLKSFETVPFFAVRIFACVLVIGGLGSVFWLKQAKHETERFNCELPSPGREMGYDDPLLFTPRGREVEGLHGMPVGQSETRLLRPGREVESLQGVTVGQSQTALAPPRSANMEWPTKTASPTKKSCGGVMVYGVGGGAEVGSGVPASTVTVGCGMVVGQV